NFAMPITIYASSIEMVNDANIYIGIFANRLGDFTVAELRRAQERNEKEHDALPMLIFIADDQLSDEDVELDPERQLMLDNLKRDLRKQYVVATFKAPEDLFNGVVRALADLRERGKIPGSLSPRFEAIPSPPKHYFAHGYV